MADLKQCGSCRQLKPFHDFYADASKKLGIGTYCKDCSVKKAAEAYQRRAARTKDVPDTKTCGTCGLVKTASQFWPARATSDGLMAECVECRKDRVRLARYGVTPEQYAAAASRQRYVCAICSRPNGRKRLRVDHDHATGAFRGLLCDRCNTAIGLMADDPDRLLSAVAYLSQE